MALVFPKQVGFGENDLRRAGDDLTVDILSAGGLRRILHGFEEVRVAEVEICEELIVHPNDSGSEWCVPVVDLPGVWSSRLHDFLKYLDGGFGQHRIEDKIAAFIQLHHVSNFDCGRCSQVHVRIHLLLPQVVPLVERLVF